MVEIGSDRTMGGVMETGWTISADRRRRTLRARTVNKTMILLRVKRFGKLGELLFNKEFSERNKITEVLLRSGMKKAPRGLQDCEALLI